MRRLIASWRPDIGESQAQSGPGAEHTKHFSPLINGILPMGGRTHPFRRYDSSSSSAFASFKSAVSKPSVNQP